jgi:hypothetical protein
MELISMMVMAGVAVLGVAPLVVGELNRRTYRADRFAAELSERMCMSLDGLRLARRGLHVELDASAAEDDSYLTIAYWLTLPQAASLNIAPRGNCQQPDPSFDTFFQVESCRADYLIPGRQALLLEAFQELAPIRVEGGVLIGAFRCKRHPSGLAQAIAMLVRLGRLQQDLVSPPRPGRMAPGWGRELRVSTR